ncbi:MAG: DUF4389 domain-containing protein [Dehalococcoidia bacterium]|nr:DUF4389 domain-containing protein [Dehalococcoidia bacterium]
MADRTTNAYPLQYSVDYPEGPRNRLTALVRLILAIPIIILSIFAAWQVIVPTFFMILFRNKYPRWWFDWNLEVMRFVSRVNSYVLLLRDEYPATDDEQAVHLDIPSPEEGDINRFMPIVKWILAIPHFIVLYVLSLIVLLVSFIAWLAILIVGRYPRGMFDFTVGVMRWSNRVTAYAFVLTTDRYPPFRLGE